MFKKLKFKQKTIQKTIDPPEENGLSHLIKKSMSSDDFIHYCYPKSESQYWISYYQSLVDTDVLHKEIMGHLDKATGISLENIKSVLPIENVIITNDVTIIKQKIHIGYVIIQLHESDSVCVLVQAEFHQSRAISLPEVEFSVVGPKESFVESLSINLNLIRKRLPIPELVVKQFEIGSLSKTTIAVIFIEGIANIENVNTVLQRAKKLILTRSSIVRM